MEKMRAAIIVEKGKMECTTAPVRSPEKGQVVVRNQFASICGSDLHIVFMGMSLAEQPEKHGYPGHEGIGEVVESRSPDLQKGDWVLTVPGRPHMNTFADYQTLPATSCIKVPSDGKMDELMMAQQLGTTIFALRQNPTDVVGKTVMVLGQGSAGMFFAYLLKRAGAAKVIAADLSEKRLTMGREMSGVDVAVKAERENVREAVMDHTGGKGVDYLVEAVGKSETQFQAVDLMKVGGKMLYFGLPDTEQPIPIDFYHFFAKALTLSSTYGTQIEPGLVSFRMALDLILKKQIDVSQLVSHKYPIEKIHDAILAAQDTSGPALKVSLTF